MPSNTNAEKLDPNEKEVLNFYLEDYKLKVAFLEGHFNRLWTRFQFFLTVELALFGFLGYLLFDKTNRQPEAAIFPILLGLGLSIIWRFIGRQDRALVLMYRSGVDEMAAKMAQLKGLEWYDDHAVGGKIKFSNGEEIKYNEKFSITQLPQKLGVLSLVLWIFLFVLWGIGIFFIECPFCN